MHELRLFKDLQNESISNSCCSDVSYVIKARLIHMKVLGLLFDLQPWQTLVITLHEKLGSSKLSIHQSLFPIGKPWSRNAPHPLQPTPVSSDHLLQTWWHNSFNRRLQSQHFPITSAPQTKPVPTSNKNAVSLAPLPNFLTYKGRVIWKISLFNRHPRWV